jgi:hypothetical protein
VKEVFQTVKFGLKRAASDFKPTPPDVAFELCFGNALRREVAAMLNAGQNGMNVRLLRAGYETGKFHVVDETLT